MEAAKHRILNVFKRAATQQTARLRPPRDAWRLSATGSQSINRFDGPREIAANESCH